MTETRYYPLVFEENSKSVLGLLVVQHGLFLYTAHKDEDGNIFWFYQKNYRPHEQSWWNQVKDTIPKYDTLTTIKPKAEDCAKDFNYEFTDIVRRSYDSLRNLYNNALIKISELEDRISELEDRLKNSHQN